MFISQLPEQEDPFAEGKQPITTNDFRLSYTNFIYIDHDFILSQWNMFLIS